MANERITEDLVESDLRKLGYYADEDRIVVEKQQSVIEAIRKGLSKASKTGRGTAAGYPEFIVTSPETPDMVVLVECKADVKYHDSANRDQPRDYAVDGVLHYARHLTPNYTVISIAVSGTPQTNEWSFFVTPKGTTQERDLVSPSGAPIIQMIGLNDLFAAAAFDPQVQKQREQDLIQFAMEMHEFMRDEAELEEKEKPLAVAGTLIALKDPVFARTYDSYPAVDLPEFWIQSIKKVIDKADLPVAKLENMTQPFTGIQVHPELRKPTKGYPKGLLNEIVTLLAEKVMPFLTIYHDFDVVGAFYGEFLKYTGGDGKGLGIVLTPKHVTELFALIANVSKDDKVLDICAGTGGFLISSMVKMIQTATTEAEIEDIKKNCLIGIEQNPSMYALGASNMILRGDGKANLYQGSCFDTGINAAAKQHKANVGMVNPPYAKTKEDLHELRFVEQMLDSLAPGGTGIAIVPVSCATAPSIHKKNLLKKHTHSTPSCRCRPKSSIPSVLSRASWSSLQEPRTRRLTARLGSATGATTRSSRSRTSDASTGATRGPRPATTGSRCSATARSTPARPSCSASILMTNGLPRHIWRRTTQSWAKRTWRRSCLTMPSSYCEVPWTRTRTRTVTSEAPRRTLRSALRSLTRTQRVAACDSSGRRELCVPRDGKQRDHRPRTDECGAGTPR